MQPLGQEGASLCVSEVMFAGLEIKTLTSLVQRSGQWACGNVRLFIKCDLFNPRPCEMPAFALPSFPQGL